MARNGWKQPETAGNSSTQLNMVERQLKNLEEDNNIMIKDCVYKTALAEPALSISAVQET